MVIPDVGPHVFRYTESDRVQTPRFWMGKLQREANAFAHEVVRAAARFPQMVISSAALRAGYARLVEWETFRVIEGRSVPQPTREDEPMRLDAAAFHAGVPELVAAELVRDVVEPKEFDEFCRFDRVTVEAAAEVLPHPPATTRPDRGLGCQDPGPARPPLRRLPGPRHAPLRRGGHEIPPRQASARPPLAGRRPLQPTRGPVRRRTSPPLEKSLIAFIKST